MAWPGGLELPRKLLDKSSQHNLILPLREGDWGGGDSAQRSSIKPGPDVLIPECCR